ncbi:MAG TPA: hypothetical protein VMZ71_00020, partial [Gemmataceae bacterium]|nr:hypothetical protein [Gemmataceae bacterium]
MTTHKTIFRALALCAAVPLAALLAGCSSDKTAQQVGDMNKSNIQRVGNLYAAFHNIKGARGPKDEAELRQFIAEFDPAKLQMMGVNKDNIDGLLTSERDGQKFQIRYNVGGGRGSVDAVVFEKVGANGTKQVGYTGGKVEDVDDSTYKELWAGKKPAGTPAAGGPP